MSVRQHGNLATQEVAGRADALLYKGDLEGQRVWKRIIAAVEDLQETTPAPSDAVH